MTYLLELPCMQASLRMRILDVRALLCQIENLPIFYPSHYHQKSWAKETEGSSKKDAWDCGRGGDPMGAALGQDASVHAAAAAEREVAAGGEQGHTYGLGAGVWGNLP